MKYTIQQIPSGEDELILRYQRLNDEVQAVLEFMNSPQKKLIGTEITNAQGQEITRKLSAR